MACRAAFQVRTENEIQSRCRVGSVLRLRDNKSLVELVWCRCSAYVVDKDCQLSVHRRERNRPGPKRQDVPGRNLTLEVKTLRCNGSSAAGVHVPRTRGRLN